MAMNGGFDLSGLRLPKIHPARQKAGGDAAEIWRNNNPPSKRLKIGSGYFEPVAPEVWAYEVSGKSVLTQWFSYRKRDRNRPQIGDKRPPSPLGFIQPDGWLAEYTTELLDVINVLGRLVKLEPKQAALLDAVCNGDCIAESELRDLGALRVDDAAPPTPAKPPKNAGKAMREMF